MTDNTGMVRWGVLGAARITRRSIPGITGADNAKLVAIASRNQAKGEAAAKQWDIPTTYTDYDALLADPQIDAVYIPLPNTLHVEWTLRAIAAGKAVLCEKPIALVPEDVQRIADAAAAKGVAVMEAFMYRFHPQHLRLRELLESGIIGTPRMLRATNSFVVADGYNIRLDKDMGGGATWDVGCYGINVARWMFGSEPQTVTAQATIRNGVDVEAAAILDFGQDRRAVLDYSMAYGRRSFYEIIGTKGALSVENMWQDSETPATLYIRTDADGVRTEEFAPVSHFQLEVEAFGAAVLAGQSAPYPLSDSLLNARACVATLRAIHDGGTVQV